MYDGNVTDRIHGRTFIAKRFRGQGGLSFALVKSDGLIIAGKGRSNFSAVKARRQ